MKNCLLLVPAAALCVTISCKPVAPSPTSEVASSPAGTILSALQLQLYFTPDNSSPCEKSAFVSGTLAITPGVRVATQGNANLAELASFQPFLQTAIAHAQKMSQDQKAIHEQVDSELASMSGTNLVADLTTAIERKDASAQTKVMSRIRALVTGPQQTIVSLATSNKEALIKKIDEALTDQRKACSAAAFNALYASVALAATATASNPIPVCKIDFMPNSVGGNKSCETMLEEKDVHFP